MLNEIQYARVCGVKHAISRTHVFGRSVNEKSYKFLSCGTILLIYVLALTKKQAFVGFFLGKNQKPNW